MSLSWGVFALLFSNHQNAVSDKELPTALRGLLRLSIILSFNPFRSSADTYKNKPVEEIAILLV